jgi:alanyl-tRNA synthetase
LGIVSDQFISAVLESIAIKSIVDPPLFPDAREKTISYFQLEHNRYRKTLQRGIKQIIYLQERNSVHALTMQQVQELSKYWGIPEALTRKILREDMRSDGAFRELANSHFIF